MNWSKIKNIMIIILVLINLFLLVDIAATRYMSKALPPGTGESFANILEKRGITIDKNVIPQHYETRSIVKAEFYDIDRLTELFIGKKVKYVSDGQSIIAPSDDKKLIITGKNFEYTTLRNGMEKDGKDILRALKNVGISTEGAYFDEETSFVKVMIDSVEVEGVYLDVFLDENGEIASLKGQWPKLVVTGSNDKVSVIEAVNGICEVLPKGSHINNIEKIYVFKNTEEGGSVVPGWRVYNQGRYYDITA